MSAAKIAVSLDREALKEADRVVKAGVFPSRSRLIQDALAEKLEKIRGGRLARECAKLDPALEQAVAEESLAGETAWPEY
ncbi:MAG TPA: ribbon-helix-helix domain-containing protein [Thermoanaerobaculia bacterium]|nr:ribbon-helix-helix domain-containing protein [Thermoanaerobaculia bacterium]